MQLVEPMRDEVVDDSARRVGLRGTTCARLVSRYLAFVLRCDNVLEVVNKVGSETREKVRCIIEVRAIRTDRRKYTTTHDTKTRFPQISSSTMMACCHGVVLLRSTGDSPVPVAALTQTKSASTKHILNFPLEAQKTAAATSGTTVLRQIGERSCLRYKLTYIQQ